MARDTGGAAWRDTGNGRGTGTGSWGDRAVSRAAVGAGQAPGRGRTLAGSRTAPAGKSSARDGTR